MARRTFVATVAAVVMALLAPLAPSSAAGSTDGDWVTADRVLVNRLGGVNVSGEFSCRGAYAALRAGELQAYRETEFGDEWYTIPAPDPTDKVMLMVNADNFTVTQPSGKRLTIQVEHSSSRMTPCYAEQRILPGAFEISTATCPTDNGPCRWETDRFGYDRQTYGPLFDYSTNGKFRAGLLNVEVYDYGVAVMIFDEAGNWKADHMAPYAADVYFNSLVKAVTYR